MVRARPDPPICPPANPVHGFLGYRVRLRRRSPAMARVPGLENRAARARAVGYLRTSSAANVGAEKDSAFRQDTAVMAHAARSGVEVVACFYDAAVSGADPVAS